jgi:hypothetical protein
MIRIRIWWTPTTDTAASNKPNTIAEQNGNTDRPAFTWGDIFDAAPWATKTVSRLTVDPADAGP